MRASTVLVFCSFSSAFLLIFSACVRKVRKTNQYRKGPPAPFNLTCRREEREIANYMKGNYKYAWKSTVGVGVWKDRCWQDQSLQFMGCLYELTVFSSTTAYLGRSVELKGIPWKRHCNREWPSHFSITDREGVFKGDLGALVAGLRLTTWFQG